MDANLKDLDSIAVCRALRQNRALSWHTPIFMITSTPATKQQRLAALEAGAWDYLSLVPNAEELALKLDAFTRVKLETDHALDEGAVEPVSGLYTMRGLERRARELVSDAFRRHAPLACVALAVELEAQERLAAPPVALEYAAHILQARGRTSDAIGRLGWSEFAVLAPSTAPDGAVRMARRLTQAVETAGPRPAGLPPLLVRAGYEAVTDLHATPLAPDRLLEHAGAALVQARATGNGERIRAYQE
jgi:PleD family two-component response regulator